MKRFCIINLKNLWEARLYDPGPIGCEVLGKDDGPQCFYTNRETAENELLRLAAKFPRNDFQIFESVACVTERKTYRVGQDTAERTLYIDQIGGAPCQAE